jgi:hypothetical protein
MAPHASFSVAAREREKQEARDRDQQRIACGEIGCAQVRDQNGFFSSLDPSRARLVSSRVRVPIAA